jgi:hypothetical protein
MAQILRQERKQTKAVSRGGCGGTENLCGRGDYYLFSRCWLCAAARIEPPPTVGTSHQPRVRDWCMCITHASSRLKGLLLCLQPMVPGPLHCLIFLGWPMNPPWTWYCTVPSLCPACPLYIPMTWASSSIFSYWMESVAEEARYGDAAALMVFGRTCPGPSTAQLPPTAPMKAKQNKLTSIPSFKKKSKGPKVSTETLSMCHAVAHCCSRSCSPEAGRRSSAASDAR